MKIKGFEDTIKWYDQNAQKYSDSQMKKTPFDLLKLFAGYLPSKSKVLDAGCASGRDSNELQKMGFDITGIDISKGLLAIAKKTFPQVKFVEGNFLKLPFENASFKGIWAHASLLHFETEDDVIKALKEFARVLEKHGVLLLRVRELQNGQKKYAILSDKLSEHNRFFQYFTKEEVENKLRKAGFTIIKTFIKGGGPGREDISWVVCFARK